MSRPLHTRPALWLSVAGVIMAVAIVLGIRAKPPELPVYATIPEFELTDQTGRPFGSADLLGKPWIADFIFTRCPTVCPLVTAHMAQVQMRSRTIAERLRLVSFSVDPDHDTPAVLTAYARQHDADPAHWTFVTGPMAELTRTVVNAMKIGIMREGPGVENLTHGTHFVLVDSQLRIRGYYDLSDERAMDRLLADAALLAQDAKTSRRSRR